MSFYFCLLFFRSPRVWFSKSPLKITSTKNYLPQKLILYFFKLVLQINEFLIVIFFNWRYFLSDTTQLIDLILNLVLNWLTLSLRSSTHNSSNITTSWFLCSPNKHLKQILHRSFLQKALISSEPWIRHLFSLFWPIWWSKV